MARRPSSRRMVLGGRGVPRSALGVGRELAGTGALKKPWRPLVDLSPKFLEASADFRRNAGTRWNCFASGRARHAHAEAQMDLHHRPSTAELTAELDGTAQRALDARVPFASRKEVERYSQLLPTLYDDRGPIEYPTTRTTAPLGPPAPSLPDSEAESEQRAAPARGARMPEGASQHTRSVEGLSVGNAWSGSALVSGRYQPEYLLPACSPMCPAGDPMCPGERLQCAG